MLARADLVIAHNAGFDRPFVERRIPVFADFPWACSFADIDWKAQGQGSAKLESLAQALGYFYDAHRAEMDCHALLAVLGVPLAANRGNAMQTIVAASTQPSYRLQATGAPFDSKDALKARGYRWDAESKVWYTAVKSTEALDAEAEWLKSEVYGGRAARIGLETQDALVQFSSRSGKSGDRVL